MKRAIRLGGAVALGVAVAVPLLAEHPGDRIAYRTLERGDFRGAGQPAGLSAHGARLGAALCTEIDHSPVRGFRAWMDRECSWWNAEATSFPPDYVLEHEQIHFALYEIAARELNAESAAPAPVPRALEAALRRAMREVDARTRRFDADTSRYYRPTNQRLWRERVERELADLL